MRNFFAAALMLLAAGSTIAAAQEPESKSRESKNEVAVTIGRTFISDQTVPNTNFFDNTVHFGKGISLEATMLGGCGAISGGTWRLKFPSFSIRTKI
jgi:hypothetical protein